MSYFGSYFGEGSSTVVVTPSTEGTATPVPSPYEPEDPAYVDFVELALSRLCEYAKAKST